MRSAAIMGIVLGACASRADTSVRVEELPSVHRPSWLQTIGQDLPAIEACLAAREEPAYAVYVYKALADLEVGVTTVNREGVAVQCMWSMRDEEVSAQAPLGFEADELSKQPLLSLGEERPLLPVGAHAEPVDWEGSTVGWLFWMPL